MSKFYSGRDKIKKSLTEYFYSVKDGKSNLFPRCHLDSWNFPCTLRDTIISPATDVCLHVTEYSELKINIQSEILQTSFINSFDCTLSGPFGRLRFNPALSLPDSLYVHDYFDLRFNGLFFLNLVTFYYFSAVMSRYIFNYLRNNLRNQFLLY